MKKLFAALALAALAAGAMAQSHSYLENSGRIYNRVETSASVTDNGTSNSVARGAQSATAVGAISSVGIPGGQALALTGVVETAGSGMAFNVSTGAGTGFARTEGWSDANVNGFNNFANQNGTLAIGGFTDSGMASPVGHGVDIKVDASRNTDGYAAGADGGSFAIVGYTTQVGIPGGTAVAASVSDTKTSHSSAETGGVTFTDGVPAGQSTAFRHANSGNVTEAHGSFYDPAH